MGLSQALDYLTHLHFSEAHLQALRQTGLFDNAPNEFWERLAQSRFTGDVWAVPDAALRVAKEPCCGLRAPHLVRRKLPRLYLL